MFGANYLPTIGIRNCHFDLVNKELKLSELLHTEAQSLWLSFMSFEVRHSCNLRTPPPTPPKKKKFFFFSFLHFLANRSIMRRVFIALSRSFSALPSLRFHLKQPRHFQSLQSAKMRFKFQIFICTTTKYNNGTLQTFIPLNSKLFD